MPDTLEAMALAIDQLQQRVAELERQQAANQALDTASLVAFDHVNVGAAAGSATGVVNVGGSFKVVGNQVVAGRATGWTAWTGTPTRTTKATSTATLVNVAEALKALLDDLITHGLIGT